jgi:hypothetical protein
MEAMLEMIDSNSDGMTSKQATDVFVGCGHKAGTARAELGYGKKRGWLKHNLSTKIYTITPLGKTRLKRLKEKRQNGA